MPLNPTNPECALGGQFRKPVQQLLAVRRLSRIDRLEVVGQDVVEALFAFQAVGPVAGHGVLGHVPLKEPLPMQA